MKSHWIPLVIVAACVCFGPSAHEVDGANDITTPEAFFGHQMGADKKLARWDKIVEYFELLARESGRIRVVNLGPTTEGHPYLLVIVTSEENHRNLEAIREMNRRLSDPRGLSDAEVERLITEGKAVVSQSFGLHSTEVAAAQTAPEHAYDLASRDDTETQAILDNVVYLMFPCFNPDGQIMVADWYNQTVGGEYEGTNLPWLYHKYVGHDNNRDADFLNQIEAIHTARVLYKEWKPQAYVDHHQMGSYGARMFVPPYSEPLRPYADPLVWREHSWYGAHIAYKLEEHGKPGILNSGQYPGWGHFGWHWITPFHNMAGMLTESASASLATPLYIHPDQLEGGARQFPDYEAQSTMPNVWPGGWWRVRDIVEQQKIAAWALLDLAARNRETVLKNAYLKAARQIERGAKGDVKAYVVPARQHDPLTAIKMINTLLMSDIEIQKSTTSFEVEGMQYGAGSYVIPLAQPKMGLIRNLVGRTLYPDNAWTRSRDGEPLRPYDTATHTMSEFMGVRVDPVSVAVEGGLEVIEGEVPTSGSVASGSRLRLDGRMNLSYKAVNLLLDENAGVQRVTSSGGGMRAGDFIVTDAPSDLLARIASETGVRFESAGQEPRAAMHDVKRMRVAMYQRYRGGSMDEGWTRFLLERFAFPYSTLHDEDVKRGSLRSSYDVIIIPHDSKATLLGKEDEEERGPAPYPPEYMSGLAGEGEDALRTFVSEGGTLVSLGDATELAIDTFSLNLRNVLAGVPSKDFFCPGSTLWVDVDPSHPLAYGMPEEALALFWSNPAFEILPSRDNDKYETIGRYRERDILQSGWLVGEDHLSGRAAMVSAGYGQGRVVLIGFRPQHRAQTYGTFKLVFNALLQ
ncbi:MAG TPA: M14 metallopeptidase family protein [Vicinamibacteria bacterium]|nr:M14 metallopeptidase family protein [Vicinamibacteria bacterium]